MRKELRVCIILINNHPVYRISRPALVARNELELVGAVSCPRSASLTSLPASALAPYTLDRKHTIVSDREAFVRVSVRLKAWGVC